MAASVGKGVYVDQVMLGGATLEDHVQRGVAVQKIGELAWDYVILQQAIMEVAFPEMHDGIVGPIEILKNAVLESNPDASVIYFMDYSMRNGLYWFGEYYSYEASQLMLYDGTLRLADALDLAVAPVGWAWNTVMRDRPDVDLYDYDGAHPSFLGSYLGAAVYFSTVFRHSSVGNPYTGGIDSEVAGILQNVASGIVLDSLDLWRLPAAASVCGER